MVDQLHSLLPRVPVPPSVVCEHTKGVSLYNNDVMTSSTRPCNSSVCLLYSNTGRCPSGPECRAFHISPTYLQQSRALTEPLCCALHNCFYSQEMLASECAPGLRKQRYCVLLDTPAFMPNPTAEPRAVELSVLHLSLTVGLETLALKGDRRLISLRRQVCRLHLEGKCKWTKDCGHVHICRELLPLLESPELLDFLDAVQGRQESHQKLFLRIQSSVKVRQYVRSVAVLPMLTQLINLRCTEALKALALAKVACIMTQYEELLRLGLVHNASEVTWVQVNEKIAPFLRPGVAADGDSVATGTPSHSPHAQQALNERCV